MQKKDTAQSTFLNLCILFGVLIVIASVLFAVFAASAVELVRRRSGTNSEGSVSTIAAGIGNRHLSGHAEGGPCQYTITYGAQTIVPGSTDTGNHCAWCDTTINLPFSFVLYDQTFNA